MRIFTVSIALLAAFISLSMISPLRSGGTAALLGKGYTGAPNDFGACINCHFTGGYGLTTQEIRLIDTITSLEVNAYEPGKLYNVEIDVKKGKQSAFPQAYGFQATSLGPDTMSIGEWLNPAGVVQIETALDNKDNSRTYVEHGTPSFSSTFKMQWRAPWSAADTVSFYYIGNAVNLNGSTAGDNGGFGAMKVYPPMGVNHLQLSTVDVSTGDYFAIDSISLSTGLLPNSVINFNTQRAVRLLPNAVVPATSSLEINLTVPQN